MKHLVFSLLAASVWVESPAQVSTARLVGAQSEVSFVSKQMGVPVEGKFTRFDATVAWDSKRPENGTVKVSIDMASASFGTAEMDMQLPKAIWFDAAKFPQATFQSDLIKPAGPGHYEVRGTMSVKGQARPVVIPFELAQSSGATVASGKLVIKRLDYRIGEGEWLDTSVLANDVQVKFRFVLAGVAPL